MILGPAGGSTEFGVKTKGQVAFTGHQSDADKEDSWPWSTVLLREAKFIP